ncbi:MULTISPECIES: NAD(P)H-dependent oxidoreductase [Metabacillus]|uniref:NAD(P)H-dependent oxidoreductase n=1 Tax=Metabacillus hrfriensis TaxID=3048891 RepID=A0ACD4R694_9BACI|nr:MULTISPECIES: NAD(P)H-dependent oxidoreductase [Metabacillus]UAL50186.1 NAD(P)H-dependent oxidoreductase [Metabacillus dongyingensis]UOK56301.1 NAD(P)H-dependent oxidoreductase [Bacillus sp. OVS6]USK26428.1 NAD(P)H-dependent oxidoreductase [Bacillus sp. CMF21]WHZ55652.1 NAD(P)H-dependent oxidoreductase [Metabacillus sp. CT-WN-B3]
MKHLVVYAHPHPDSFNHAILETAVNALEAKGHEVVVRDLYALDFQPVLKPQDTAAMKSGDIPDDIRTEQKFITQADIITFIYPIWWTGLPAIIKGYVDRVFSYGYAYAYGEEGIIQLLKGKKGLIINTHGTPKEIYDQMGMTAGLKITSDIGIFDFTGIEPLEHLLFGNVSETLEEAVRKDILRQIEETINSLFK